MTKIFHVLAISAIMLGGVTTASMAAADGDATQPAKTLARPGPTAAPSDSGSTSTMQTQPMPSTTDPATATAPNDGSGTGGASGASGGGKK